MKRAIAITYTWWNNTAGDPLPEHVEHLEAKAWEQIIIMMSEGCTSGELNTEEYGDIYRGHWDVSNAHAD